MDDLIAKLRDEKPKMLSSNELAARSESLRQLSADLEHFLADATCHRAPAYGALRRAA